MGDQVKNALPTDMFSKRYRDLSNNPGAVRVTNTVTMLDDYGHTETWVVDTFRVDGGETVFLQRINADDTPVRLLMPPQITAVLDGQRDRTITRTRKRVARQVVEMRRERGDQLGNPEALRQARRAKRRSKRGQA